MNTLKLKWILAATMLVDHVGYAFIPAGTPAYIVSRCIGRLTFPLVAFLLAEGYFYTSNVRKYLVRLGLFVVVSELPFDRLFFGRWVYWEQSNVFVTLFLGLLGVHLFDRYAQKDKRAEALLCMAASAMGATLLRSDYGAFGVLMIFIFYRYRTQGRSLALWYTGAVVLFAASNYVAFGQTWGLCTLAQLGALPLMLGYNRQKGYTSKRIQTFFYVFYPLHILVLLVVKQFIGGTY